MLESNRRDFIKTGLTASGSLIVAMNLPLNPKGWKAFASDGKKFSHHYFEITSENQFIFIMDKVEMGQGVYSGQLTLFGEEAKINPSLFKVKTAPVKDIYATFNGHMITGGSSSTPDRWMTLRKAGANVRELMKMAAAKKWQVPIDDLSALDGVITNSESNETLKYSELIAIASTLELPKEASLTEPKDFKYIGKRQLGLDVKEKSTGSRDYGIDFEIDNMLVAVVERCPTFGGSLKSFNAIEVKKMVGVKDVFPISSGVAIVCEKYWQTIGARRALKIEWNLGKNKDLSSEKIISMYKKSMEKEKGHEQKKHGNPEEVFKGADKIIEAEYSLPYLAHATMEPMNAVASVQKDRCDIWSPNQGPSLLRNDAARILGMSRDKVHVHTSKFLGGGFGRRSTTDYTREAVELSKKMKQPIQVIWSREDDTRFSPMRPITFHKVRGAIKGGKVTGWEHKLGCESIMQLVIRDWFGLMLPGWVPGFLGNFLGKGMSAYMNWAGQAMTVAEGAEPEYAENFVVHQHEVDIEIPLHFWRSVGHSYNGFVKESFADELAHAIGEDPVEFRLSRLGKNSRLKKTLEVAKEKSGWGKPGVFMGVASHKSFNSYVTEIAEVEVSGNDIKVNKVTCVVDCGVAINPDIIKKQMESGIIYGLSAVFGGEITIENGGVVQQNFDSYPTLRMSQTPEIEVHIIESNESPTGVGEPGLPPIAPAVANAIFAATGKRLRTLPLRING